jgi:streptogramin lyase
VVVNSGTNCIGIFLNYGNGTFASQMTFTTGNNSRPLSAAVGDFNNDTHFDIAVTNYDTHNIGIFLGYGNGIYANQTTFGTGASRPLSIAVGDFNNDHCLDIVITNSGTNYISILFGYGNGSFENQITYFTGYDSLAYSVIVKDFNNDYHLDIALANYGTDNIGIFLGYGNGSFMPQKTYSTAPRSDPYSIAADDFNNDGELDIFVANSGTNNIGILLGSGNGSFGLQTTYGITPGSRPHSIVIADFNQDKQLDVAVSNYDTNNISVLIGFGNGSFAAPIILSTGIDSSPSGMIIGDFDNNNYSDIAIANSGTNCIFVLIEYSMVQSDNPPAYSAGYGASPYQIAVGDFNNDTQIDISIVNSGTNNAGVFLGYGNGSFQEQMTYSTGENSHPYAIAISDLDNDHRLDIIVGNSKSTSVGILYGYGNGSFTTVVTYFTGNNSALAWITIDDFNNDNQLDIAFADYSTNSIGIFLGYKNRTIGNLRNYACGHGSRPYSLVAEDFNNDGRLDIITANYGVSNIAIFLGVGDGSFYLFNTISTGDNSSPSMVTSADLNKDNHSDVVVANSGTGNISVFFGFGNGTFMTQLTYSTGSNAVPYWVVIGDFNNDHSLDLAVANSNINNVGVLLGDSYGYFGNQTTYSTGFNSDPFSIAVGDFNQDNRLDIAAANFDTSNVAILLGHPSQDFEKPTTVATDTDSQVSSATIDSLNRQNQSSSKIANWPSNNVPILLGDYYATFLYQTIYSTGSSYNPYSIAIGDLNNDTYMDIVVTNSVNGSLGILLGHGNGTFAPEIIYPLDVGSSPEYVIVDDFNHDNRLDVVVTDAKNDNIVLLLGNGNGTFSSQIIYPTGSGSLPSTVTTGNLNNDRYLDLVVANGGTDTVGIFFGYDYTVFARQKPRESGDASNPYSEAVGDFNNDGYLDIVSALYGTCEVGVLLGYGNGSFTAMMSYGNVTSSYPFWVAVGDFNNDNQLDITVANWGSDSISVVLGYGNGTFAEPILHSTGSGSRPVSVAVGDFNNDSCLDITAANYGGDSLAVFLGYGNGSFRDILILQSGENAGPSSVTVTDVNNDTKPDIIVANYDNNNVGIFLGYGNGSFAEQVIFSTGNNSSPYDATVGDFNKDGRFDLAVANYGTSNIGILYGYGDGTFGNFQTYATGIGSSPTHVEVGDFNNDNQLDIVVGGQTIPNVGVFFGYSDGTFASFSPVLVEQGSFTFSVAVGDFNNDSRLDFSIPNAGTNNIEVFLSSGSKSFGGQTTFFVGEASRPSAAVLGHFNNDSHLDIAITNSGTSTIGILLGYGNRMFSNITTYSTNNNSHPVSLATGDFNNDSLTDIVVANWETNDATVFVGHGDGSFSKFMSYSMGDSSQPLSIAVGDFNRDYRLDIVVANYGTNHVCVLFGSGNGTFIDQAWYPLEYDSRPSSIIFQDLNNDGWEDTAVATSGIDNIKVHWNLC